MSDYKPAVKPPQYMAPAQLDQAAPVQNNYYTILNSLRGTRLHTLACVVQAVGENLQLRITIDGVVSTLSAFAAVAGIDYEITHYPYVSAFEFQAIPPAANRMQPFIIEARHSLLIEIRKITLNGAGNLQAKAVYAVY